MNSAYPMKISEKIGVAYNPSFFGYIRCIPHILVPDNLKIGVIKNTQTELILNHSYHEMSEHYVTAIIPASSVKPQNESNVEGAVKILETLILAALRNRIFFTFNELNKAIRKTEKIQCKVFLEKERKPTNRIS